MRHAQAPQTSSPTVIDTLGALTTHLARAPKPRAWPPRKRILMVPPDHFRVEYAINPFMRTETGELQTIDADRAEEQWHGLKGIYEELGYRVETIDADEALPDMVFTANQSLPFWSDDRPAAILSRMRSPRRQPEVLHFRRWYEKQGYAIHELVNGNAFLEGNGDALPHPERGLLWGGVGQRTSREAYDEIAALTGLAVVRLPLTSEAFYHLDTCFAILSPTAVAIQPKAFAVETVRMVHEVFDQVIDLDWEESLRSFAGNCHSPDGKTVIVQRGARKLVRELHRKRFDVIEVDTGEFLKSGGSVFCLKMHLF